MKTLLPIALLLAALSAGAADPGSTNRVDLGQCPPVQTGPGQPAVQVCELGGNPQNRSAAETGNAGGRLRVSAEARVNFEALQRRARTESRWLDTLVFDGGTAPSRLRLDFLLDGTLGLDIVRGTISPPGVEQGDARAWLDLAATPGAGWSGAGASARREAGLARAEPGAWQQPVAEPVSLWLDLGPLAPGARLDLALTLGSLTEATNDWFRQGGGRVLATTDVLAGWTGLAWLDAAGQDLGEGVQWHWAQGLSPVPAPGPLALWLAGLLLLWGAGARAADPAAVVVNGRALPAEERSAIEAHTGVAMRPGRWWYDTRSGLWGAEGQGAAGFAPSGLDLKAALPADASRGTTGVFFNGRQLSGPEVRWLQTLGPVWPGRYWLDAFGNVGLEGQALPFANLALLAQARRGGAHGSVTRGGTWIASDGNCVVVSGKSSSGIGSFGASNC